jgi:hypothetical protein
VPWVGEIRRNHEGHAPAFDCFHHLMLLNSVVCVCVCVYLCVCVCVCVCVRVCDGAVYCRVRGKMQQRKRLLMWHATTTTTTTTTTTNHNHQPPTTAIKRVQSSMTVRGHSSHPHDLRVRRHRRVLHSHHRSRKHLESCAVVTKHNGEREYLAQMYIQKKGMVQPSTRSSTQTLD